MPYFGERQSGGGYGAYTGIEFEGLADTYNQRYDTDKNKYVVSFKIKNNTEQYTILIDVYQNTSTSISVTSSKRLIIRYDGITNPIENVKNQ